jgi:hypothetical protein
VADWTFAHRDLDEPHLPDGSRIMRPCVEVSNARTDDLYVGVVDSGSPITVADPAFVREAGVDLDTDEPVMEVPLGLGANFGRVRLFEIEVELLAPFGLDEPPVRWRALVGARPDWRLPFAVLFGQRGWFDRFPTTIDATGLTVHVRQ